MNNTWVQIIGTFLIGGSLLNWILPLYLMTFGAIARPNEVNNSCITLGGKVYRKWFFFNVLIYLAALIAFTLIIAVFRNWVMFVILIPYFILLFVLSWGNIYKRWNSITDNHHFSLLITLCWAIFALCSNKIYSFLETKIVLCIGCVFLLIYLLLFILPAKHSREDD